MRPEEPGIHLVHRREVSHVGQEYRGLEDPVEAGPGRLQHRLQVPEDPFGLLGDPARLKLFHFGRFDIAVLLHRFAVLTRPVYCTKIASRLVRTYTDRHGLKDLVRELLDIDISKQQQSSDWGANELTPAQVAYASSDVLHLHRLKAELDARLEREGRRELAQACFDFLPQRARLDLAGWGEVDVFAHS